MDALIVSSRGGFTSVARADEIAAFFDKHALKQNQRKITQTLEGMRASAQFAQRIKSELAGSEVWARVARFSLKTLKK